MDGSPSFTAASHPFIPLLVWLLVQLAALILAALRVPLAAQYPQPAEFQAVRVMLGFQFIWATILLGSLLANWRMAVIAICSAWMFLLLAAVLAGWSLIEVVPSAGFLSLWMVVLATIAYAARSMRWRMIFSAVASTYVLGGALLIYLQSDFGSTSPQATNLIYGPLYIALSNPRHVAATHWWGIVGMEAFALLVFAAATHTFRPSPKSADA
jgi:hypothetical protein